MRYDPDDHAICTHPLDDGPCDEPIIWSTGLNRWVHNNDYLDYLYDHRADPCS